MLPDTVNTLKEFRSVGFVMRDQHIIAMIHVSGKGFLQRVVPERKMLKCEKWLKLVKH